jgi:hypothetical protein
MSAVLPRVMMAVATCCLEGQRRDWAVAMEAEFHVAVADARAWSFASGCLIAAWRDLPAHGEGRLLLVRYAVAFGVIIPMAALLLSAAVLPLPMGGYLASALGWGSPGSIPLIHEGNRAAAAVLAQLIAGTGALRLGTAWAMLDRDWARVAAVARLNAAATVTLAVLAGLATLDLACALLPATALVVEIPALLLLARLHARASLTCNV